MPAPQYDVTVAGVRNVKSAAVVATPNAMVATNAAGLIDASFVAGLGQDQIMATASEAIAAGAPVNLYSSTVNSATVLTARNADAATANAAKKCMGFATAAIAANAQGIVQRNGPNTAIAGLTPGIEYFLGNGGTYGTAPPNATGTTSQLLGVGIAGGGIDLQPGPAVAINT